jgi:hypothetical protein
MQLFSYFLQFFLIPAAREVVDRVVMVGGRRVSLNVREASLRLTVIECFRRSGWINRSAGDPAHLPHLIGDQRMRVLSIGMIDSRGER